MKQFRSDALERIGALALLSLTVALPGVSQSEPAVQQDFRERARQSIERQMGSVVRQNEATRAAASDSIARQLASVGAQVLAAKPSPKPFLTFERIMLPAAPRFTAFDCPSTPRADIDAIISDAARRYDLAPNLIQTVIKHESAFDPCAVSRKGALGLMQLMPGTAADLGVRNPFDAQQNIDGGAQYLSAMLTSFDGDLGKALAAYNAGPAAVRKHDGTPPYAETRSYVASILRTLGIGKSASD